MSFAFLLVNRDYAQGIARLALMVHRVTQKGKCDGKLMEGDFGMLSQLQRLPAIAALVHSSASSVISRVSSVSGDSNVIYAIVIRARRSGTEMETALPFAMYVFEYHLPIFVRSA